MKKFKFEEFKEKFGSAEEITSEKEIIVKNIPDIKIPENAIEEDISCIMEYNSLSDKEKLEIKEKTDKMIDWINSKPLLLGTLLRATSKKVDIVAGDFTELFVLGDAVEEFSKEFGFNQIETLTFFKAFVTRIRNDFSKPFKQ